MKRLPRRVLPATVLALLLLAGCVAVAALLIQNLTSAREYAFYPDVVARLHTITWGSRWMVLGGALAIVAGLALLVPALVPGRAVILPLDGDDGFVAGIARRGWCGALLDAAKSVEGVRSARVRLRRNKIRVKVRTAYVHSAGLDERVRAAVDECVTRIGPDPVPRVVVATRSGGKSAEPGEYIPHTDDGSSAAVSRTVGSPG